MASLLVASSCSQEEIISQSTGNEVKVTFKTELRNDVKSRAVGDDTNGIDELKFVVYDESGNHLSSLDKTVTDFTDGENGKKNATVEVVLVKGQTYSFAFWAQDKDYEAYSFNASEATVTIDYDKVEANCREADAFFASVKYTVTGTFSQEVTLKRPFAQVNFLTTADDIIAARKAGFDPKQSSISVKNVAKTLNVLTGEVSNTSSEEVTFQMADLLMQAVNNIETTNIKVGETSKEYKYLATAYFLPDNATAETQIDATMNVKANTESKATTTVVANGVPAQRNYRTNIYGNLLTSTGTFNVVIDPDFEDNDHNVEATVYTVNSTNLENVLDANKELTGDLIYNVEGLSAVSSVSVEIPSGTAASNLTFNFTDLPSDATLEVKNAENANFAGTVILKVPSTTTLASTTVTLPSAHVILAQGGFGNTSASTSGSTLVVAEGAAVGNLTVNQGNVEIEAGGKVETVKTGESAGIVFVYVEEGADKPTVDTESESSVIIAEEKESAGDYTIDLSEDLDLGDGVLLLDRNTTINGNGKKISSSGSRVIRLTTSGISVTMNNVNVVSKAVRAGTADIRGIAIDVDLTGVELTLNSCSVDFTDDSASDWAYAVNQAGGNGNTITISGGSYEGANVVNIWGQNHTVSIDGATLTSLYEDNEIYFGVCVRLNEDSYNVSTGNELTVKNTTFNGEHAVAIENIGGENNTVITENNTDNTKFKAVKVENGDLYYTLAEALAAIETEGKIKLCHSIQSESVKVTGNVTLDLNGETITGTDNATGSYGLIDMQPESSLNIINTESSKEGKITLTAEQNRNWDAYSSVISNQRGTLTIGTGVVIEHLGGTDMAYGVDNLTNGKGTVAKTTIDGATIKSTYRAIRQFLNGTEATNELHVKSGVIEGTNKSIWMQDPSKTANTGKLVVEAAAQLKGDVYLYVTAGSTEWPVDVSINADALVGESKVLSANVPEGYDVVKENNIWKVVKSTTTDDGVAE